MSEQNKEVEEVEDISTKGLELHVSSTEAESSVVPVHWCISPEALAKIKEYFETEPYLLLITTPEQTWTTQSSTALEHRIAVPLKSLMTYVDFKRAGQNCIVGIVIEKTQVNQFLKKDENNPSYYDICLFLSPQYEDKVYSEPQLYSSYYNKFRSQVMVNVPKEVFAADPPEWEKKWVNACFRYKPHDQCDYRKRRLFAYTVQPLVCLSLMALRLVIGLFMFSCGFKINVKNIFNVLNTSFYSVFSFRDKEFSNYYSETWLTIKSVPKKYFLVRYFPAVFLPAFHFLNLVFVHFLQIPIYLFPGIVVILTAFFNIGFFSCTFLLKLQSVQWFLDLVENWEERAHEKRQEQAKKNLAEAEAYLLCHGQTYFKVKDLPKKQRTVWLKFRGTKAAVCRPFSR